MFLDWPGSHYVGQAGPELREIYLLLPPPGARVKGVCHHTWLFKVLINSSCPQPGVLSLKSTPCHCLMPVQALALKRKERARVSPAYSTGV